MSEGHDGGARYRRIRPLGEGGGGRVWLAEDLRHPGSRLALKELTEAGASRIDAMRREFAVLSRLTHPNLVRVHDFEPDPSAGGPFFTMEFVEGDDIVSTIRREGAPSALDRAAEALRALAFLHDFDLVHRDLKPANVLVRSEPLLSSRLVVLDFGLAMRGGEGGTGSGPAGTLATIAPEIFDGAAPSARSDLYALGVVVHEAIHGRPPVAPDGVDIAGFLDAVRSGRRARPALPPGLPTGLRDWLEELLAPRPADRPGSAREALARLNDAAGTRYPAETPHSRAARIASGTPPGRDREIEILREHVTTQGEVRLMWLAGGTGTGKERMIRWLHGDAIAAGADVMVADPRAGGDPTPERWSGAIERAAVRPTVVLVVDAASAGGATHAFLERIAQDRKAPPVRVVATIDPADVRHPVLRRLLDLAGRSPSVRRVDLGPLDFDGLRALAVRATGERSVAEARVRWLQEVSEGNPLVAELLLTEETWEKRRRDTTPIARDRSIELRLARMSASGVAWIRALAALDEESSADRVAMVAGLAPAEAAAASAEMAAAGFALRGETGWKASSRSQSRGTLELISEDERRVLFKRAAEQLAAGPVDSSARRLKLARTWARAGEREAAATTAAGAGEDAIAERDPHLAADSYALALASVGRRDPRRAVWRAAQAASLRDANLPSEAARAYGAAARLARDEGPRADLRARQAEMLVQAGRFDRAEAVAEDVLAWAEARGEAHVAARAHKAIGIVWARRGQGARAQPHLRQAAVEFARLDDVREQAHALQSLAVSEANDGVPDARSHFEQAIALYGALGEPQRALMSGVGLGVLEQRSGSYEASDRVLTETMGVATAHANRLIEGIVLYYLARNALHRDRLVDAIRLSGQVEDQAVHTGDRRLAAGGRTIRAAALARCGRAAEAAALVESTLERDLDTVDPSLVGELRLAWAEAALARPRTDEVRLRDTMTACLADARRWNEPDMRLWCLALEMERRARPPFAEEFEPIRAEFDDLVRRGGHWAQPFHVARADTAEATALIAAGRLDDGLERARRAAERAERAGLTGRVARAWVLIADALERGGRGPEAADARARGRRALDEAAAAIPDEPLRKGFLENPAFAPLAAPVKAETDVIERRLLALYDMIRALNSETDPDALLERILDMAVHVVGAQRGMILLRDPATSALSVSLARNLEKETIEDVRAYSNRIVEEAGAGRPVLALDALHDERFRDNRSISQYRIRSLMCVPLKWHDTVIGTVYVDDRREGRLFSNDDLRFLEAFADHASLALHNARERARLIEDNRRLQAAAEERVRFGNIIGRCAPMQWVFGLIEKVAVTDFPVLVQGETGTGKELVARAIHFLGKRRKAPFISENCAALPETLLQSELFGHVRGAFTGADRDRRGLFELADGGTLFLDEVGDMSPAMQAQLLRVLQEGEVRRVGGDQPIKIDVRPIMATHRDLEAEVAAGRFREDLMYRLQVLVIQLPPLRDRAGDLPLLVDHFLDQVAEQGGRPRPRLHARVVSRLEEYDWPGNIRQLQNAIYRLAVLAGDGPITEDLLAADPGLSRIVARGRSETAATPGTEADERERIKKALERAGDNRARAARLLGISRATIYRKIREYDL